MSAESFKTMLRGIGQDVVELDGIAWSNFSPYLYSPIPYQLQIRPDEYELDRLFNARCFAIRCVVPQPWGLNSYQLVIADPTYDLQALDQKSRNQTRRGLESCKVREISFSDLAKDGISLHIDTLSRQGRHVGRNIETYWKRYFECAGRADCASAWGAYVGDDLAAYLVAITLERTAHVVIVRSASRQLRHYPNNALIFRCAQELLQRRLVDEVSIGYESMQSTMGSLDRFKEGMGFKRKEVRRYVRLSPLIRTALRGPAVPVSRAVLKLLAKSERARKLDGLLKWHLRQRLPNFTDQR